MARAKAVLDIYGYFIDPWNKLGTPGSREWLYIQGPCSRSDSLDRTNLGSVYTFAYLCTSTHVDSERHMDSYANDPSVYLCGILSVPTCFYLWRKIIESHHYKESRLSSDLLVALRSTKVHTRQPLYKNLTQLLSWITPSIKAHTVWEGFRRRGASLVFLKGLWDSDI